MSLRKTERLQQREGAKRNNGTGQHQNLNLRPPRAILKQQIHNLAKSVRISCPVPKHGCLIDEERAFELRH